MGFWTIFGTCFAALWAICSVIAIPTAIRIGEDIIRAEDNRLKGNFGFVVAVIVGPLLIGVALAEFLESCND